MKTDNKIHNLNCVRVRSLFGWFIVFMMILLLGITVTKAFPPIATEFYGVAVQNLSNASVGANVTAYDSDNVSCGEFLVVNIGYYGALSCQGDDPMTPEDEGAVHGDNITFFINGSRAVAFGNVSWHEGVFQLVNLTTANLPPFFTHNLTPQIINESDSFLYDVNCSDFNPFEVIIYYENSSFFEIDNSTGVIQWTPADEHVGNHSFLLTCSDGEFNTTGVLNVTVLDINNQPLLFPIGPQIAVQGELFSLSVFANDSDRNDTLTFSAVTTLFGIATLNSSSTLAQGFLNFTPTIDQVGNYTINFSVSDGLLADFEIVPFNIVLGPFCGDNACSAEEDCQTCSADCGVCPDVPGEGEEGGEGEEEEEGDADAKAKRAPTPITGFQSVCHERWKCSEWSVCSIENIQTRRCLDINKCGTQAHKPSETRNCIYVPTCFDGIQNGDEEGVDCGGPCVQCLRASCFDGIQNQGEEGVDCGGPCAACEIRKPAALPGVEVFFAPLLRVFPWLLLLLLGILIVGTVSGDYSYMRRISKHELKEYRKRMNKYRPIRRRIYKVLASVSGITLIASFYIYYFSTDFAAMRRYVWIPILLIVATPYLVSLIMRRYRYYEYRKKRKEALLLQTHKREVMQLMSMEDEILSELGSKLKKRIFLLAKNNVFKKQEAFYKRMRPLYSDLTVLEKRYEELFGGYHTDEIIKKKMRGLLENQALLKIAKEYIELALVVKQLKAVLEEGSFIDESELLFYIKEISLPHIKTVILSDKELVAMYNVLVDIFDYFHHKHVVLEHKEQRVVDEAHLFTKQIKELAKDQLLIDKLQKNAPIVWVYNRFIELFDHYTNKNALHEKKKTLKDEKVKDEKK